MTLNTETHITDDLTWDQFLENLENQTYDAATAEAYKIYLSDSGRFCPGHMYKALQSALDFWWNWLEFKELFDQVKDLSEENQDLMDELLEIDTKVEVIEKEIEEIKEQQKNCTDVNLSLALESKLSGLQTALKHLGYYQKESIILRSSTGRGDHAEQTRPRKNRP